MKPNRSGYSVYMYPAQKIDHKEHSMRLMKDEVMVTSYDDGTITMMDLIVRSCLDCGEFVDYTKNGETIEAVTTCKVDATLPIIFEVAFLSGKVVIADSLHHKGFKPVRFDDHDEYVDYNTYAGQKTYVEEYARRGVAYGPVGNTSPDVFFYSDGTLTVEQADYDEDTDEIILPTDAKKIAGVCTDLWAYSIMDYDEWVKTNPSEDAMKRVEVAEIPAGIYRFEHYGSSSTGSGYHYMTVFAKAERIA